MSALPVTCFIDSDQKVWDTKINLKKALMVDRSDFTEYTKTPIILSSYNKDSVSEIFTNNSLLFAVIGVLVRDQSKRNLAIDPDFSPEKEDEFQNAFASNIEGEQLEPARSALVEAISDFCPAAKTVLSTFLQRVKGYEEKISRRLNDEILPEMDQKIDELIDNEFKTLREKLKETSSL